MAGDSDQGDKNMKDALTGDVSIAGSNKDQIIAMGGEIDDELDDFKPSAADRGDVVDDADKEEDKGDGKADDKKAAGKGDDVDEDEEKDDEDGEADDADPDSDGEESEDNKQSGDGTKPDDTDDADESDDEEDESEDKKPAPKKGDDQRIPKARFDEVNARRKAAEEELERLKAQQKAKDEGAAKKYDFKKNEREYMELMLDGKLDDAMAKREEIDAAKEAEWIAKQQTTAASTVEAKAVKAELDSLVVEYEGLYPTLDPKSEEYSEDIVEEALSMYNGYLNTRQDLTPGQAFKLAVNNVVKIYDLKKAGGNDETEEKPNKRVVEKKDVKKKLKAAKEAPKDPAKAGGESGADKGGKEVDIEQMTDEEYDALPESVKKRLRGDIV